MSPTEMLHLSKGRIPAWIVLNEIKEWLAEQEDTTSGDDGPLSALAARSGVSHHTLNTWLGQERVQSIAFDVADTLLVKMGRWHLWRARYWDYYYGVNLDYQVARHRERRDDVCRNGHARTPENTIIRKRGGHECRTCQQINSRRYYAAKMGYAA